jgi:hypothetical protein
MLLWHGCISLASAGGPAARKGATLRPHAHTRKHTHAARYTCTPSPRHSPLDGGEQGEPGVKGSTHRAALADAQAPAKQETPRPMAFRTCGLRHCPQSHSLPTPHSPLCSGEQGQATVEGSTRWTVLGDTQRPHAHTRKHTHANTLTHTHTHTHIEATHTHTLKQAHATLAWL